MTDTATPAGYMNVWQNANGGQWLSGCLMDRRVCDHAAAMIAADFKDIRRIAILRVRINPAFVSGEAA